jgi:hypothetical protein
MDRTPLRIHRIAIFFLLLSISQLLSAQSAFHVFPQIADGRFPDGSAYRSTVMILPSFEGDAPQCTLTLYGTSVAFPGGGSASSFAISVPAGQAAVMQTTGAQSYQGGYGTLSCSTNVTASVLYTFYAASGAKVGEATVFSSSQSVKYRLIADHREGARLGIAIANNTDSQQGYLITYVAGGSTLSNSVTVPARRAVARFLDEIVSVPAASVGVVTITSPTLSNFSVIGLRFTGGVFTTIPPG